MQRTTTRDWFVLTAMAAAVLSLYGLWPNLFFIYPPLGALLSYSYMKYSRRSRT